VAEYGKLSEAEIAEAHRLRKTTSSLYLEHRLWEAGKENTPEYSEYSGFLTQLRALQELCEHIDRFIRCHDCCERDPSV
jgi:hypothetical protein